MEKNIKQKTFKKPNKRFLATILIVLIVAVSAVFLLQSSKYVSTDDAYIESNSIQVVPKVAGHIVKMYVEDNQFVNEGDLIAKIDETDYKVKLEQAGAAYDSAFGKQKAAKANFNAVNSQIALAKKNLDRYTQLYNSGAASKLEYDTAKIKYDEASAVMVQAQENLLSNKKDRVADSDIKQLASLREQARLALSYTNVYARQSGYITNKNVVKGAFVQAGQPICAIVQDDVWVVANFKEIQMKNMKIGQNVDITLDTYPNKVFKGKVDSIQMRSGAKSSLFPPENAVGSFVKIVQRIPVKIVFDEKIDPSYNIITGMSVVPRVRVK